VDLLFHAADGGVFRVGVLQTCLAFQRRFERVYYSAAAMLRPAPKYAVQAGGNGVLSATNQ